jgi:sugar phosphate permease
MGFVAAAGFVPISSVLSKWFGRKELGFAMEIFSGVGGGLGQALTFLVVPLMALVIPDGGIYGLRLSGWRGSTFVMGIIVFAIAIASTLLLRSNPAALGLSPVKTAEHKKENADYKDAALGIGKDPALWIISLVWSGYIIAARLAPGWLPLYATEFYMQNRGISKPHAIVAGGAMATLYVLGRTIGTPMVGKLSDVLLKKHGVPRAAVILVGLLGIAALFYALTATITSVFLLGFLYFLSGVLINIFPLINASAAEIWSSRTEGFSMGMINTVGQLAGAAALSASGFLAVKYSVAGGAFHTEFLGIWYLGIITSLSAAVAALYMVRREKKAADTDLPMAKSA